jgi:hypothetical protein
VVFQKAIENLQRKRRVSMNKLIPIFVWIGVGVVWLTIIYIGTLILLCFVDLVVDYTPIILNIIPLRFITVTVVVASSALWLREFWVDRKEKSNKQLASISPELKPGYEVKKTTVGDTVFESVTLDNKHILTKFYRPTAADQISSIEETEEFHRPRRQHYLFVRKYIPDNLQNNPEVIRQWLTGDKATEHLITRWSLLPFMYNISRDVCFSPEGMGCRRIENNEQQEVIFIQFPTPERMTEAFFGAVVFSKDNKYRYFTLEVADDAITSDCVKETIFNEWRGDEHKYLAKYSTMNSEDFLKLVLDRIDPLSQEILLFD